MDKNRLNCLVNEVNDVNNKYVKSLAVEYITNVKLSKHFINIFSMNIRSFKTYINVLIIV